MSLRTPLGRARGLGSAKDGVGHWWMLRLTAVALVPLSVFFVVLVVVFKGADHVAVTAAIANPLIALILLLFIVAGFWHLKIGVEDVIEDYIHDEGRKIVCLGLVTLGSAALAVACTFSVLKIAIVGS